MDEGCRRTLWNWIFTSANVKTSKLRRSTRLEIRNEYHRHWCAYTTEYLAWKLTGFTKILESFFVVEYLRYNAFTWNGLMCYLTNEGNKFYLNSFPLESEGNETTKKQLWFLNDAREAFGWRKSRSFVCGDAAYIFFSRKYASHSTISTRLVRINLRDSTIKDLTRSVEGVTDIRTIREGAEDGKSIYLIGEHQAHNRNTLWKLSCQAQTRGVEGDTGGHGDD
uniref:DDE Tnp4 domain-containing protein n=1 Tax=Steinernema glaseri TaxID=37863 RepID=A0A1I7Y9I4_9BILA